MYLKTLLFAYFSFRIYFTSASDSKNVIGPGQCTLDGKSNIVDAKKLKSQYMSERGVGWRRVVRGDDKQINTLEMDELKEICQCFAKIQYGVNAKLSSITVNEDFVYRTKPFLLGCFGFHWNEVVIECEVPSKKFYLAESEKYCSELYHRNVYIFEISSTESTPIWQDAKSEKWVIDYPKGEFKALYPEVHMRMY